MKLKDKYRLEHYVDEILPQYLEDSDNICRMKFIDYIVNIDDSEEINYLFEYIYANYSKLYNCLYPIILEYGLNGFENLIGGNSDDVDCTTEEYEEEYDDIALDEKISNMSLFQVIGCAVKYWWSTKRK